MADVGSHFIVALSGCELSADDRAFLRDICPFGIFLRRQTFDPGLSYPHWVHKLGRLIDAARSAAGRPSLAVAIDHEGGRVHRTLPPFTRFPYQRNYAARAYEVASAQARELTSLGVNLLFGPVADIDTHGANPVIGPRAFSSAPLATVEAVLAYTAGIQEFSNLNLDRFRRLLGLVFLL